MTGDTRVDYAAVLVRKRLAILAVSLLCGSVAAGGWFVLPKSYESGAVMAVGVVSYASANPMQAVKDVTTETVEPVLAVRDAILSKPFMAQVITKLGLQTTPEKLYSKVKAKVNEDIKGPDDLNRQIIVTGKAGSPADAKALVDTITELTIQRHKTLFSQAIDNRRAYEEVMKTQLKSKTEEMDHMKRTLQKFYDQGNPNTASLVLIQANILNKEELITNLKRELSQAELLDRTNLKSANTVVSVPSYLPGQPTWSLLTVALSGLIAGLLFSAFYFISKEAL